MNNLKPGLLFADRYTLIEKIGRGGYASVWKVKRDSGFIQAIKIFTPLDDSGIDLAREEFEKVFNLNHHRLLKASDYGDSGGQPYLVMPYCERGNVQFHQGNLGEKELAKIIFDISSALEFLHGLADPIIHQDIKPDNILIDDHGNYLLADFGISKRLRRAFVKSVKSSRDTDSINDPSSSGKAPPAYRPPEVFSPNFESRSPIKASDIWSLGATMYEMATRNVPFGEFGGLMQRQGSIIPDLPSNSFSSGFNSILKWCMSEHTWDRPNANKLSEVTADYLRTGNWSIPSAYQQNPPTLRPEPSLPRQVSRAANNGKKDRNSRGKKSSGGIFSKIGKEIKDFFNYMKSNFIISILVLLAFLLLFFFFSLLRNNSKSILSDKGAKTEIAKPKMEGADKDIVEENLLITPPAAKKDEDEEEIEEVLPEVNNTKVDKVSLFNNYIEQGERCMYLRQCDCANENFKNAQTLNYKTAVVRQHFSQLEFNCKIKKCKPKTRNTGASNLKLNLVELTPDATIFTIALQKEDKGEPLIIYAKDHENAFRIKNNSANLTFKLKSIKGIIDTENFEITEEKTEILLTFDRLPQSLRKIDLIQGIENSNIKSVIEVDLVCLN